MFYFPFQWLLVGEAGCVAQANRVTSEAAACLLCKAERDGGRAVGWGGAGAGAIGGSFSGALSASEPRDQMGRPGADLRA